jgi:hypothetical protein
MPREMAEKATLHELAELLAIHEAGKEKERQR